MSNRRFHLYIREDSYPSVRQTAQSTDDELSAWACCRGFLVGGSVDRAKPGIEDTREHLPLPNSRSRALCEFESEWRRIRRASYKLHMYIHVEYNTTFWIEYIGRYRSIIRVVTESLHAEGGNGGCCKRLERLGTMQVPGRVRPNDWPIVVHTP